VVWLESTDVAAISNGAVDPTGNTALDSATAAAAAFVESRRPDLITGDTEELYHPTADVKHGAAMLALRLYERRGSVLGVAASAGFEEAAQILRYDPDIEQLLRIGRYRPFGFGAPPVEVVAEEVVP